MALFLAVSPFSVYASGFGVSPQDSLPKKQKDKLKSKVKYTARDSMRFDIESQKVYLYGDAEVHYEDIDLKASSIMIDWQEKTVSAKAGKDSLGKVVGKPEFKQGPQTFKASEMKYNFESKRGKIIQISTTEGEGFIQGESIKKEANNNFYIKNGLYTTCSADTPHFYIGARKLEVIKDDKIVTGPAFLVVEGVTTPLFLPFGFFPHKSGRSSGIIIPAYGESDNLGFNLRNGGYYFGISDNMDLALRGDIYTKGSWAANATSNYNRRYKFNGNFRISYSSTISGDQDDPKHLPNSKDFFVNWSHTKDPKSSPNNRFSASVNAGSSTFYRNYITYNPTNFLSNTFQSSISYSRLFPSKPYFLNVSAQHSQNTLEKTVNITFPNIVFGVNRINFFKTTGIQKWYHKIGASYGANLSNQVQTADSLLFKKQTLNNLRNGLRHSGSISTSFNLFKYINVSPGISINDYMYIQSIRRTWNNDLGKERTDTVHGFANAYDFAFSTSVNTRLYGMVQFKNPIIKAIRHVLTPSAGFSIRPDFSESKWGFYGSYKNLTTGKTEKYSYFANSFFGGPAAGKSSLINFNLDNNLEVKVRDRADTTTGTKKIKVFESFNISSAYNLAADSMRLSNIGLSGRTTLIPQLAVNFSGTVNPYVTDSLGRNLNYYQWDKNRHIGRLTNANFAVSYSFNSATFKPAAKTKTDANASKTALNAVNGQPEEYIDFNIPWSFNVNYNVNYNKVYVKTARSREFTQSLNFSGDLSLTPKWKISYSSGYDFLNKDITYTNITIYRDLHCWEMRFYWIPFGVFQSYNFQINVKSSILQDLKLLRRRDWNQIN